NVRLSTAGNDSGTTGVTRAKNWGETNFGVVVTTAETTPHGPSQRVIMAAQPSKAMPTGPRNIQAASSSTTAHRRCSRRCIAEIVSRGLVANGAGKISTPDSHVDRPAASVRLTAPGRDLLIVGRDSR